MTSSLTVTHHTARLNEITQHWVSAGDGPPVYLLHGFPETWYAWRKQIPVLAELYTVIAPDLRGLRRYREAGLRLRQAHDGQRSRRTDGSSWARAGAIIGHDRGARVGTRFAKDHRKRIDRFVAMDNVPTRILMENSGGRVGQMGWFVAFLGVPDLPETLIAGREEAWLTHFYRSWSYNPDMLSPRDWRLRSCLPTNRGPSAAPRWTTVPLATT